MRRPRRWRMIHSEWKIGGISAAGNVGVSKRINGQSVGSICGGSSDVGGINQAGSALIQLCDKDIPIASVSGSNRIREGCRISVAGYGRESATVYCDSSTCAFRKRGTERV